MSCRYFEAILNRNFWNQFFTASCVVKLLSLNIMAETEFLNSLKFMGCNYISLQINMNILIDIHARLMFFAKHTAFVNAKH